MITDSIALICDSVIDAYIVKFIDNLTSQWSDQGQDQEGLKNALEFLYKAIRYDENHFNEFLKSITKQNPDFTKDSPAFKPTIECLQILSRLCSGNYDNNPWMIDKCQELSNMSKEELSKEIGKYFKDQSIKYLKENYSNRFGVVEKTIEKYYRDVKAAVLDEISSRNLSNSIC